MKVIVNGLDLSNAVIKVIKAVSTKTTNPILEGIRIQTKGDNLILSATDLELSIEKTIICETFIEGQVVVAGKLFSEFTKKLEFEDQVELNLINSTQLRIKYSDNESLVQVYNALEFPKIKRGGVNRSFKLNQKDFKDLINKTAFCCSTDDNKQNLKGCLLEISDNKIKSVAVDGHRLGICEKPTEEASGNFEVIVPSKGLNEIVRLLEINEDSIELFFEDNNLTAEVDNTTITTRLLNGKFIAYKNILPKKAETQILANKTQLLNSIERALVLAKSLNNVVMLDIKEGSIHVTANSVEGNINELVPIKQEGKDLLIAVNAKYLIDVIRCIDTPNLKIKLNKNIEPMIITEEEENGNLYLILPVRYN